MCWICDVRREFAILAAAGEQAAPSAGELASDPSTTAAGAAPAPDAAAPGPSPCARETLDVTRRRAG